MKSIIKIGCLLASVLLFTQSAFAQGHPQDGFYVGIDGGYDITKFKDYTVESLTDREPTDNKTMYNDEGIGTGIFVGFRLSDGQFTLAVEGRYGYSFIQNEELAWDTYKQTNEFGGSILPGFWINDQIVLFGRVGFSQQTTIREFDGIDNDHSDTGLHFGAGIQFYVSDSISLRGEYNRATFNHEMAQVFEDTSTDPSTFEQVDFTNNFRRDRFQVSIVSRF
ncbi:MAG: porin family protein [Kordiimonadaceae bacterium]|nr:porin family protein [Kordiimonadaceae bacterium]MBT6037373.1 porin family protein [Kordiimonadaceae bacterium]MBT7582172.1 porin family protein [Kordiimonadaceae bacterium]